MFAGLNFRTKDQGKSSRSASPPFYNLLDAAPTLKHAKVRKMLRKRPISDRPSISHYALLGHSFFFFFLTARYLREGFFVGSLLISKDHTIFS